MDLITQAIKAFREADQLGKVPTKAEIEIELNNIEALYDDVTEVYINRRLRLLGLLQAAEHTEHSGAVERLRSKLTSRYIPRKGTHADTIHTWLLLNGPAAILDISDGTGIRYGTANSVLQKGKGKRFINPNRGVWSAISFKQETNNERFANGRHDGPSLVRLSDSDDSGSTYKLRDDEHASQGRSDSGGVEPTAAGAR